MSNLTNLLSNLTIYNKKDKYIIKILLQYVNIKIYFAVQCYKKD